MATEQPSLFGEQELGFDKKTKIVQANALSTRVFKTEIYDDKKMSASFLTPSYSIHHYNIWYIILHYLKDLIKPYQKDCSSIDYRQGEFIITIPLKSFTLLKRKDYRFIKDCIQDVLGTFFHIESENEKSKSFIRVNVFSKGQLEVFKRGRNSYCKLHFTRDGINLIGDMSRGYHVLNLKTAMRLKSTYSKRLYELISRYRNTGIFRISESKFRNIMILFTYHGKKTVDKYKYTSELKRRVLDPSVKELNAHFVHLNLKYEVKENRHGENMIYFIFAKNKLRIG